MNSKENRTSPISTAEMFNNPTLDIWHVKVGGEDLKLIEEQILEDKLRTTPYPYINWLRFKIKLNWNKLWKIKK